MPGSRRKEPGRRAKKCGASKGGSPTFRVFVFSFSRRKSNRFFDDLRKGFPVYLDPKNQNTFFLGILEAPPAPPCI